jgi:SAM-dependent methyltransferase
MKTRAAPYTLPERIDGPVDADTLRACLASLAAVNRASFGHRPSVAFALRVAARAGRPVRLLDVGSGYGDTLRAIAREYARRGIAAQLTGADLNPDATAAARAATRPVEGVTIEFVTADARTLAGDPSAPPDGILSALFTHHLEDEEIVPFLRMMEASARVGWLVNDLHRSRFAAEGFRALATLTGRHPMVRHDGPVSFARAFRRADWERLLAAAGISGARIFTGAPFRLCVERLR